MKSRQTGLSIVVLNLDSPELLNSILDGFRIVQAEFQSRGLRVELIVGDTGSSDPQTLQLMSGVDEGITFVRGMRYHFSSNNNVLFNQVSCDVVLFLNNDVLIADNPLAVVEAYERHRLTGDVVSTVLDFPDGKVQHRGVEFLRDGGFFGLPYHPLARTEAQHSPGDEVVSAAVTGAFLMIDSDLFARIGGFDEAYEAECQDIDLCLRVRRLGVKCRVLDAGRLVHIENATRPKGEENWSDRALFLRRWSSYIETL
jgi:GT2 family glycosyltransferase